MKNPLLPTSDQIGESFNEVVELWERRHRQVNDALSASLFCDLKMLGLLPDWPEMLADLTPAQVGQLRFLANQVQVQARLWSGK